MIDSLIHVQVKIYPWFSGILIPGLQSALLLDEELPAGCSLRTCLLSLTERYSRFSDVIYDPGKDILHAQVVITHNELLLTGDDRLDLVLQDGDSIYLIPVYAGG